MEKFVLYGNDVFFNEEQLIELNMFRYFFPTVYKIVNEDFLNKILELNMKNTNDRQMDYYDYQDDLEKAYYSCFGPIYPMIFKVLHDNEVYTYGREEVVEHIELSSGLVEFSKYIPFYNNENYEDISKDIDDFKKVLRTYKKTKTDFVYGISTELTLTVVYKTLIELYVGNNPGVDRDSLNEEGWAFKYNDIHEFLIHNEQKNIRTNIEQIGVNDSNVKVYVKTLEKSPFNVNSYLYLLENAGDIDLGIEKIFEFVFGTKEIIKLHKEILINKTLSTTKYNNMIKRMPEEELLEYKVMFEENGKMLGISIVEHPVYQNVLLKLNQLDESARTVDGIEFSSRNEANTIKLELEKLNKMVSRDSLLDFRMSMDQIKVTHFEENELIRKRILELNDEFEKYKYDCKFWEETYKKNLKKFIVKTVILICIALFLLSFGIVGIIIDVFIVLYIRGDYEFEVQNVKAREKQYLEYCAKYGNY